MMQSAQDWRKNIQMQYYTIEITELAESDLENAGDYIAFELENPIAALNTVKGIQEKINSLKNYPERNELDDDEMLARLGIRREYFKNYKIYYIIDDDTKAVKVIRILHMLVDSKAWLYRTFGIK